MDASFVDLHTHSTFSDGSVSPGGLAALAKEAGLSAIVLTDHDTTKGVSQMLDACKKAGIKTLPGIELSCTWKDNSIHILGYGMDWQNDGFQHKLMEWQNDREERYVKMTDKLRTRGYEISMEALHSHFPGAVLTRAHIAVYLAEKQMIPDKNAAFSTLIGKGCPCYVPRKPVTPDEAIRFLLKYNGIPVFAHPLLCRMCEPQLDALIGELTGLGLRGIEGYYSGYTPEGEAKVARYARKYGLFLTGGSDFHGTAKPSISVGTGKGGLRVPVSCYENIVAALTSTAP